MLIGLPQPLVFVVGAFVGVFLTLVADHLLYKQELRRNMRVLEELRKKDRII